jgi:hypothetical protein
MDSERIEELLNKYWNCETTLEEEQQLKAYFRETLIPDRLKDKAAVFRYFEAEKKKSLNDVSFEKDVIISINVPKKGKVASLVFNAMRIAAGIVVLMLAVWLVRMEVRKSTPVEMTDTYNDPKMAFEETKKALMMISKSFGTAEQQAKKINLFNEAQKDLRKGENENASEL